MPPAATAEVETENPPASTMSNWLSSMSEIGTMVNKTQPPPAAPVPGVGEVSNKEPKDGTPGSPDGSTVDAPQSPAATAAAVAPAPPKADAAAVPGKPSEADAGEDKWPRSKKDWDQFKENRKKSEEALRSQIAEREAKIKEFEAKMQEAAAKPAAEADPNIKAKLDALEAENRQLTEKIMVLDVTQHPEFKAYFENKTKSQVDMAKNIVGPDKVTDLDRILSLPDGKYKSAQLEDFMSDLTTYQLSRFGGVLNNLEAINQEREAEIAKAGVLKDKITAKELQTAETKSKERQRWFSETLATVQGAKELDLFRPKEGDAAWNANLDARINRAKDIFLGKSSPADIAGAALFAASLPMLVERHNADIKARDEKIAKLESQLKTLTAAQPSGERGTGAAAPGAEKGESDGLKEGMTPHEAGSAFVKSMHTMLKMQ